jgi:hypothetical protein
MAEERASKLPTVLTMLYNSGSSVPIMWWIDIETRVHVVPSFPQIADHAIGRAHANDVVVSILSCTLLISPGDLCNRCRIRLETI